MAYPQSFLRLVVSGTLYGTETFSFGLSFIQEGASGGRITEVSPAMIEAVRYLMASDMISSRAAVTMIKANQIGPNGRYVDQTETVYADVPPIQGGGFVHHPPQIALAVTLDTDARRGLASKGRFYLPAPSLNIDFAGLISVADAERVRAGAVGMIERLQDAMPGHQAAVLSDVREGAVRQVRAVRVGRVLDTMRSRRKSIAERHVDPSPVEDNVPV